MAAPRKAARRSFPSLCRSGRVTERVRVVAAVAERDGRLLVCQRPCHKRHGGLWEFPGGKIEVGEDYFSALQRELEEELDVRVISVGEVLFRSDDCGSEFTIVFVPTLIDGDPQPLEHDEIRWTSTIELLGLPLAPSDK